MLGIIQHNCPSTYLIRSLSLYKADVKDKGPAVCTFGAPLPPILSLFCDYSLCGTAGDACDNIPDVSAVISYNTVVPLLVATLDKCHPL